MCGPRGPLDPSRSECFHGRLFVHDGHESKSIGRVRRPVVLRSQANVARLIFALVIEAERLNPGLRCFLVEPTARENPAGRLDAQRGRAGSLVGNYIDFKARILKMIFVGLVNRPVIGIAVMR
jgi:hypothetical protein